jgi:hypothetical protein
MKGSLRKFFGFSSIKFFRIFLGNFFGSEFSQNSKNRFFGSANRKFYPNPKPPNRSTNQITQPTMMPPLMLHFSILLYMCMRENAFSSTWSWMWTTLTTPTPCENLDEFKAEFHYQQQTRNRRRAEKQRKQQQYQEAIDSFETVVKTYDYLMFLHFMYTEGELYEPFIHPLPIRHWWLFNTYQDFIPRDRRMSWFMWPVCDLWGELRWTYNQFKYDYDRWERVVDWRLRDYPQLWDEYQRISDGRFASWATFHQRLEDRERQTMARTWRSGFVHIRHPFTDMYGEEDYTWRTRLGPLPTTVLAPPIQYSRIRLPSVSRWKDIYKKWHTQFTDDTFLQQYAQYEERAAENTRRRHVQTQRRYRRQIFERTRAAVSSRYARLMHPFPRHTD